MQAAYTFNINQYAIAVGQMNFSVVQAISAAAIRAAEFGHRAPVLSEMIDI
jgi:hypothetical protein